MCIIAKAAAKKFLPRENFEECMRSNNSGFWMLDVRPDGTRRQLRTMSQAQALKFFDETPDDDAFVTHCRIPSRGDQTADNIHGWEEDGILFAHNMTISSLNDLMEEAKWKGTDSEFFFRKIFMPLYRAFGAEAFKDGKLHPYIDTMVRFFAGPSNRFLFVMADNTILTYGKGWVTDFEGKVELSNSSYRIVCSTYRSPYDAATWVQKGGYGAVGSTFPRADKISGYDCDYSYGYGCGDDCGDDCGGEANASVVKPPSPKREIRPWFEKPSDDATRKAVIDVLGREKILQLALCDLVIQNVMTTRICDAGDDIVAELNDSFSDLVPNRFTTPTSDTVDGYIGAIACEDDVDALVCDYAEALGTEMMKLPDGTPLANPGAFVAKQRIKTETETLVKEIKLACNFLNIRFDWTTTKPDRFAFVYVQGKTKSGTPCMVRLGTADTIVPENCTTEDAEESVGFILKELNKGPSGPQTKKDPAK